MTLHPHDRYDFHVDDPSTQPQQFDTLINTMRGLIASVEADQPIAPEQSKVISDLIDSRSEWFSRPPLRSIKLTWTEAIDDGVLTLIERSDLLRMMDNLSNRFYRLTTESMQQLHGIMGGFAADGKITDFEIDQLRDWMKDHAELCGYWPFDEVGSLITSLKSIPDARKHLLAWCSGFISTARNQTVPPDVMAQTIEGSVCACQPSVIFDGHRFCVTGASPRAPRREIEKRITALRGHVLPKVRSDLDYLIYCADGNPTWAYGCYGRKVEQVAELRRGGHPVVIVHESDFWDAIQDQPTH